MADGTCKAFDTVPSCHDRIATKQTTPGVSPPCTPTIVKPDIAIEFLKKMNAKRNGNSWYLFLSATDFADKIDDATRWRLISQFISSVQSLLGEHQD